MPDPSESVEFTYSPLETFGFSSLIQIQADSGLVSSRIQHEMISTSPSEKNERFEEELGVAEALGSQQSAIREK